MSPNNFKKKCIVEDSEEDWASGAEDMEEGDSLNEDLLVNLLRELLDQCRKLSMQLQEQTGSSHSVGRGCGPGTA